MVSHLQAGHLENNTFIAPHPPLLLLLPLLLSPSWHLLHPRNHAGNSRCSVNKTHPLPSRICIPVGSWGSQTRQQARALRSVHARMEGWAGPPRDLGRRYQGHSEGRICKVFTEGMALDGLSCKGAQVFLCRMRPGRRCGGSASGWGLN